MAKITSKTQLVVNTELTIDTSAKTITLNVAGNLVAKDGCTLQALYSKLVDLWTTSTYNDFPFPMYAIDALSGQFSFGTDGSTYNGWKPGDVATRQMLRDGGWSEYSAGGVLNRQYVGIVSLGTVSSGAQLYYQADSSDSPTNFTFTDAVNQGIQVFGDSNNGNFNKRSYFKGFVREYAKKFKDSVLADTGKTATGAYLVNLLLSNEDDLKVQVTDTNLIGKAPYFGTATKTQTDGGATAASPTFTSTAGSFIAGDVGKYICIDTGTNKGFYKIVTVNSSTSVDVDRNFAASGSSISWTQNPAGMTIEYFGTNQSKTIGGGSFPFKVVIEGNGATLEQIYTFAQYQLRQANDIDIGSGTVIGKTASALCSFTGDTLYTTTGVFINNLQAADLNRIVFTDQNGAAQQYPYSSSGTLNSNAVLTSGGTGYYTMWFTTLPGDANYGTSIAVIVNDKDGTPITGTISGSSISFTFDYDGNIQGGRTPGEAASVTVVAGNAGSAKPVVSTATITKSKAISISLVAESDRVYSA